MHQYLTAIGFGCIKSKKALNEILTYVENTFTQHELVSIEEDNAYCEFKKEFAEGIGITSIGSIDIDEIYKREFYIPYFAGSGITTYADVLIDRRIDREAYVGICEDVKVGISLIFHLQNSALYLKKQCIMESAEIFTSVTLSGLCNEGMILLPVMKDKSQEEQQKEDVRNRMTLISAAKTGDPAAIESLTLDDIDIYSKVSRRLVTEDVFSIVDTYIMPYGVECDRYSILGTITGVRKTRNEVTEEEIYIMSLDVNDLVFDICVPVNNVVGEPSVGRRFKGNIWMQGYVNFE